MFSTDTPLVRANLFKGRDYLFCLSLHHLVIHIVGNQQHLLLNFVEIVFLFLNQLPSFSSEKALPENIHIIFIFH